MMLTTKGRYAVMAMVDITMYSNQTPVAIADIAERQEITHAYLEQIFALLRRAELVKSVRGPGGGYLLARAADEISVADIVSSTNEAMKMTRCEKSDHKGCMKDKSRCVTHDLWDGLENSIQAYLDAITLEDVCERRINTLPIIEDVVFANSDVRTAS